MLRRIVRQAKESTGSWGRPTGLAAVAAVVPLVLACGQGADTGTSAPAAGEAAAPAAPKTSVEQLSADGRLCLDLVRDERYADAIDPCERAVKQGAGADVQQALADARAAVQQAGQAAAAKTVTGVMEGQSAEDAAKQSGSDALKSLTGKSDD